MDDASAKYSVFPKVDIKNQQPQTTSIIDAPATIPPKPIIYEGKKPNFQNNEGGNNKDKLIKRLVELDVGLHVGIAVLFLILIGALISFSGKLQVASKNGGPGVNLLAEQVSGVTPTQANFAEAKPSTAPVYINGQVLSIDKAFNSEPTNIKLTINGALKKEVFGFLPYWTVEKADDIDIRLLTTVSYFGLEVGGDGEIMKSGEGGVGDAWNVWQNDQKLNTFLRKLKKNRTKLQLTFKAFSNDNIEKLVRNPQASRQFINNVLYQVSARSLDGVNIDFEYVGTPPEDVKDKFSLLISNLNKELKRQYPKSKLTIATYAMSAVEEKFFDVELLAANSDALVIMGYDFHTPGSSSAGPVAPLGGAGINLSLALTAYLDKVAPEKIILAVPYYGYGWPTQNSGVNSEVVGDKSQALVLSYAEIIDSTRNQSINWDEASQTPWYSFLDSQNKQRYVVHFENARSLGIKYDLINKKNLQGVGIWALGLDGRNADLAQLIGDKFAQ